MPRARGVLRREAKSASEVTDGLYLPVGETLDRTVHGLGEQISRRRPTGRRSRHVKNDTFPFRGAILYLCLENARASRLDHYYAMCAVMRQHERVSVEGLGGGEGVEMSKYRYNGGGRFNISLKYLSSYGTVIYESGWSGCLKYYTRVC